MSKTTIPYADLGKAPADLIGKGFPAASTIKTSHESTIPFGVVFKNSLTSKTDGSKVVLTIEPEYKTKLGDNPVTLKGKWTSAQEVEGSASVSDLFQPGTEVKGWASCSPNDKKEIVIKGGVELGYTNDTINVKVKTDHPHDFSKHKVDVSFVAQPQKNLYLGVNFDYCHAPKDHSEEKGSPYHSQFRLHAVNDDGKSSVTVAYERDAKSKDEPKLNQLSLTWFQKHDDSNFATSFVIPHSKPPTATMVSEKRYDSTTSIKSKITLGGENRFGVAYTQSLNPYMVGTVGVDLNANKLVGGSGGGDHAFGFEVKLK